MSDYSSDEYCSSRSSLQQQQQQQQRTTSIRASPSNITQFNQSNNDNTHLIGRGSPIGASSDATGESGDDGNRRPSPQLLFAFNGGNATPPTAATLDGAQMPPAAPSNKYSPTVMSSRSTFIPHSHSHSHSPNVAGRLPPSLALEKPALRESNTDHAQVQRRSRSSSAASSTAIAQAQALQLIRRGDTLASADGDDEYAEELQLIPSSTRKPGVALRNRSLSAASASPSLLPQSLLQEQASCGTTSRVLVVCASGILFMVLLAFCTVIGLRMAAHVKYDNSLCMARLTNEHHSSDPETRRAAAAQMDRDFGFTSDWKPNYDYSTWDKQWFEEKARLYFLSTQEAASFAQPNANANNPDDATAADGAPPRGRTKPISKGESQMEKKIQQLWQAGSGLEHLRLNHFKTFGSHNSYHKASSLPLSMHQYSHATLPEQLQTYRSGLRQLELDVHIIRSNEESSKSLSTPDAASTSTPKESTTSTDSSSAAQVLPGAMVIYHLQWIDDRTSCYCLSECLELINDWSATHPSHFPIFLFYEIKSQMWEDIDTGLKGVSCEDVEKIEQEILQTFPRDRLILPIDVRGGIHSPYITVQQALNAAGKMEETLRRDDAQRLKNGQPLLSATKYPSFNFGWPTLKASVGKIIVVWLDDMHSLADRLDCVIAPATGGVVPAPPTPDQGDDKSAADPAATSSTGAAEPTYDSTDATAPTSSIDTRATVRLNPQWYHAPERISFIAQNSMDKSYSSIITQNKPQMATRAGTIVHAIAHGYLVRTMTLESSDVVPDPARFNAALSSGAHIISTDFEDCQTRSTFHSPDTSPGLGVGVDDSALGGNSKAAAPGGKADTAMPPATSDPSAVLDSDLEGSADQAVHNAAASHASSAHSLDTVLPSVLPGQLNNSTALVYCEHLPDRWPFGCNQLSAPHFCESAMSAVRMHLAFAEMAEKDNNKN